MTIMVVITACLPIIRVGGSRLGDGDHRQLRLATADRPYGAVPSRLPHSVPRALPGYAPAGAKFLALGRRHSRFRLRRRPEPVLCTGPGAD